MLTDYMICLERQKLEKGCRIKSGTLKHCMVFCAQNSIGIDNPQCWMSCAGSSDGILKNTTRGFSQEHVQTDTNITIPRTWAYFGTFSYIISYLNLIQFWAIQSIQYLLKQSCRKVPLSTSWIVGFPHQFPVFPMFFPINQPTASQPGDDPMARFHPIIERRIHSINRSLQRLHSYLGKHTCHGAMV